MKTILILAANPRNDLSLDREIRDLESAIAKSRDRQEFVVKKELAVRVEDLQDLMLKHCPQIVHFCGHGEGDEGLVFDSDRGLERRLRTDALSDLFRLCVQRFTCECVLLNACYSEAQADAIVSHIDYVVGMRQTIQDNAAIAFSKGFYRALGYDCTIEQAYEFGCNAIQLEISGSSVVRSSVSEQQRKLIVEGAIASTSIPEHLKPILKKRPALVARPEPAVSQTTQIEIRLDIDKSLEADFRTKQYRDRVREYLGDRELSKFEEIRLNQLRRKLGLTEAEAEQILAEEFAPIHEARGEYAEMLTGLLEAGHYPFDENTQGELQQLQQELQLTDAEVESITHPILEAERDRREREEKTQEAVRLLLGSQHKSSLREKSSIFERFEVIKKQKQESEQKLRIFQQEHSFVEDLGNGVTLEMVAIPAGEFLMGSDKYVDEQPIHLVNVSSFYISKFPITQEQYVVFQGSNPAHFRGTKRPVEGVSWKDAIRFCIKLSQKTSKPYSLPSEAQWEYACRAGTSTAFYFGDIITTDLVNFDGGKPYDNTTTSVYRKQTTAVGSFPSNAFGLYDMHGNVWEWCLDRWHNTYKDAPTDGSPWVVDGDRSLRVLRGGSWIDDARSCRSAERNTNPVAGRYNDLGFRVVCSLARTL